MKITKLKELVLVLLAIILITFIIKYLNIIKYLGIVLSILIPVFIGFIYAWIFNPLIKKLSKKHKRNFICISLFLVIITILFIFFYLIIPLFYKEILELGKAFPTLFSTIESKITNMGFKVYLDKLLAFLIDNVPLYLLDFVKCLFKYFGISIIGLILGLYISMDYENIIKYLYEIVPKKFKCVFINLTQEVSCEVRKCVNSTLLVASCVFILDTICFWLIGLDASFLLGLLCGLTDLIPYIGPYIGGLLAVMVGFTESRLIGILTLIACVVVQCIENYILQPIIMSKSIKISPVLILIGLLVFGNLFGIVGMILATPIIAIIKVLSIHLKSALEKCK